MNLSGWPISAESWKACGLGFAISAVLSFPIMALLKAMKSRQTVSQHAPEGHQKKQGTPTMGGLIILAGFFGALPFISKAVVFEPSGGTVSMMPLALLMALFALIGFVDDYLVPRLMPGKRGLGWKQKILMQLVCAIVPLYLGGYTDPVTLGYGTFLILFFANAYNFSDGLDWLSGTILFGMLLGMIGLTANDIALPIERSYCVTPIFALLGALIPFLAWNKPKAKVFMGDVGSLPIGAFLGGYWFLQKYDIQAMTANPMHALVQPGTLYVALGIWSVMMIVELVPVPIQIASVKLFKRKVFPYTPVHHAFEKAGWPEFRVVMLFAGCQLVLSALAVFWVLKMR